MLRTLCTLALALVAAPLAPIARAEGPAKEAAATIGLQLQVIAASTTREAPDPKLKALQKRLEKMPFQSFKLLGEEEMSLGLQSQGKMTLPGGRLLEVQPQKFEDGGKLLLRLNMKGKNDVQLVSADAAISPGGDLFVAMNTKDQGTMFVYIRHSRTQTP